MLVNYEKDDPKPKGIFWLEHGGSAKNNVQDSQNLNKAIEHLNAYDTKDKQCQMLLANANYFLGNYDSALSYLESMGVKDSQIIQCYLELGRYEQSSAIANELTQKNEDDAVLWYQYALSMKLMVESSKELPDFTYRIAARKSKELCKKKIDDIQDPKEKEELTKLYEKNLSD